MGARSRRLCCTTGLASAALGSVATPDPSPALFAAAAYIGCGLGVMGGQGSISLTGGLADALGVSGSTGGANDGSAVAVVQPSGSWVMLARYGEDDPLAFCGLQVCAKKAPAPANGTASA